MPANPFIRPLAGTTLPLNAFSSDQFEPSAHFWSKTELDALALAYAARRPLLVRGEPGSGKSQLARAAAVLLNAGEPLVQVVHPRLEPRDLLYRYDTIRRLADANTSKGIKDEKRYVEPGVLWRAWDQAQKNRPVVVLLDEIDKGDADVPNSLLEVLGQRSFRVEEVPRMRTPSLPQDAWPLVVLTTNEERELPAAFVRRCIVLNLNPPEGDAEFLKWLRERVDAHAVAQRLDANVIGKALNRLLADRKAAKGFGHPKPGLAEALDLLTALAEITDQTVGKDADAAQRKREQEHWLGRLAVYALIKHADADQTGAKADDRQAGVSQSDADED
jgi:MoxR-like ATPase